MKFASVLFVLGAMLNLCGCATVVPPAPPADPANIYLTNYGKHSSILLPAPQGHYNEYAFGDFKWFALNHVSIPDAVRALFFCKQSTIGRRQILLSGDVNSVAHTTGARKVSRIVVSRAKVDQLIDRIDAPYNAALDTSTYNALLGLWFVKAGPNYSAFHNCNHQTARWLEELGCRIKGPVMFSAFNVATPKENPNSSTSPAAATARR